MNLKPSASQKHEDEESETEKLESRENINPEDEEDTEAGDLSSNLDGYPETKGINEKGKEEANSEGNSEQSKSVNEGNQAISSGVIKPKITLLGTLLRRIRRTIWLRLLLLSRG